MAQGNSSTPLRFWLDEYAFTPGETTLLREEIEVLEACCHEMLGTYILGSPLS